MNELSIEILKGDRTIHAKLLKMGGELMEVSRSGAASSLRLGDTVTSRVHDNLYSSRIVQMNSDRIVLFTPSLESRILIRDQRRSPRVAAQVSATLLDNDRSVSIQIVDISLTGVGFIIQDEINMDLYPGETFLLVAHHEYLPILPAVEITERLTLKDETRYGALFQYLKEEDMNRLRLFILNHMLMEESPYHTS
jgi:c-di-GMP-binding flagellar brake protein YcgR